MQLSSNSTAHRHPSPRDFRIICDCQRHALHERRLHRRAVRGMHIIRRHLQRRGIALLVGVPIAFGAIGIPIEAMDVSIPILSSITDGGREAAPGNILPIFTTRKIRDTFLDPDRAPRQLSLEVEKERFFSTEVPYGSIIYRESVRNRLSPELVAAVVESESDFRVHLVSGKNARGLMQIIPETGRLLGCEHPFDPTENIAAGTKYLRYLLDRFGDQNVAVAAYNAGEGSVERFGGIPPFAETQTYVRRVASRMHQYRQRIHNRYIASVRMNTPL
jgi:Transglycosylase SLT domain